MHIITNNAQETLQINGQKGNKNQLIERGDRKQSHEHNLSMSFTNPQNLI